MPPVWAIATMPLAPPRDDSRWRSNEYLAVPQTSGGCNPSQSEKTACQSSPVEMLKLSRRRSKRGQPAAESGPVSTHREACGQPGSGEHPRSSVVRCASTVRPATGSSTRPLRGPRHFGAMHEPKQPNKGHHTVGGGGDGGGQDNRGGHGENCDTQGQPRRSGVKGDRGFSADDDPPPGDPGRNRKLRAS